MLPTETNNNQPAETGREAIKRDFYNLDELIGELNVPKEEINNIKTGATAATSDILSDEPSSTNNTETIAPEVAALSGKMIAGTIDTAFSTGCAIWAKTPKVEKYEATEKQMSKLEAAWAAVAKKYNYDVSDSPWFNLIALNAGVYYPLFKEAQKDHRFAEVNERLAALEKLEQERQIREKEKALNPDVKTVA
jgi:hypothetical protein